MAEVLHSPEAESSVLGGLLVSPVEFAEVSAIVRPADFGSAQNATIFAAMGRVAARGSPIDLLTVGQELEDAGETAGIGGWHVLGVMVRDTPSAANVVSYARVVKRFAVRRRLLDIGLRLTDRAHREPDPEKILAELRAALDGLDSGEDRGGPVPLRDLLPAAMDLIDGRFSGVAPKGMTTGLSGLDALTLGLHDGDLVVVAGRPGMGKSVLGLQFAERVASEHRRPVLFVTAEMPNLQQVERLIAAKGRIDHGAIRSGKLADADWARMTSAVTVLADARIWFDETPAPLLADVLAKARRLHRAHGPLGLVVVDHAGLVETGGENRQQSQAAVGRALKALAKELSCPVVALVQLNRTLEQRGDKRPVLSDLRESGEWEQSADTVVMIYRDEVYDESSPDKGCAELLVRKQRGGMLGVVPAAFIGQHARFESLAGGLPSRAGAVRPRADRGIDF